MGVEEEAARKKRKEERLKKEEEERKKREEEREKRRKVKHVDAFWISPIKDTLLLYKLGPDGQETVFDRIDEAEPSVGAKSWENSKKLNGKLYISVISADTYHDKYKSWDRDDSRKGRGKRNKDEDDKANVLKLFESFPRFKIVGEPDLVENAKFKLDEYIEEYFTVTVELPLEQGDDKKTNTLD